MNIDRVVLALVFGPPALWFVLSMLHHGGGVVELIVPFGWLTALVVGIVWIVKAAWEKRKTSR
jgi:hypothetical protein